MKTFKLKADAEIMAEDIMDVFRQLELHFKHLQDSDNVDDPQAIIGGSISIEPIK